MEDLKSCPFCGAPAFVTEKSKGFRVECVARWNKCLMNMRTHHFASEIEAREAWNKRIPITLCPSAWNHDEES